MIAHSPAAATSIKTARLASAGGFTILLAACALLGGLIALANPNYQWSECRDLPYGGDFLQEWVAGDLIFSSKSSAIYDPVQFSDRQHDVSRVGFTWSEHDFYPAVYPPIYYCLVAPMAALPYRAAAPAWLALMLAAYAAGAWLVERTSTPHRHAAAKQFSWLFWCTCLLFPPLFMGLVMGQKGTLWFLIVAASWHLWRRDRAFAAGCVWGLLAIKPTLCFLLPIVMLAHRQWRFSSGVIVGTIALGASTGLVVPTWLWSDYWEVVVGSTNYQAHGGYRSGWSVSLWSWLRAAGCSREVTLWLALLVGTVLFAALVRWPGGERQQRLRDPEFLLRALMTTALLSPHFYFYDLVWLLVPIHGLLGTQPRRALAMVALLWLSVLAVQSFDQGPPLLSLLVLSMLAHATRHAANCGTAFAISNRVLITSQ